MMSLGNTIQSGQTTYNTNMGVGSFPPLTTIIGEQGGPRDTGRSWQKRKKYDDRQRAPVFKDGALCPQRNRQDRPEQRVCQSGRAAAIRAGCCTGQHHRTNTGGIEPQRDPSRSLLLKRFGGSFTLLSCCLSTLLDVCSAIQRKLPFPNCGCLR